MNMCFRLLVRLIMSRLEGPPGPLFDTGPGDRGRCLHFSHNQFII